MRSRTIRPMRTKVLGALALVGGAVAAVSYAATDGSTEPALVTRTRVLFTADGRGEIEPCG